MASPSERATFPVDSPSSRRFNPTAAASAGHSGSRTVSSLERSFGDLEINPSSSSSSSSPSLPPPSPGPTGGIVSRTLMERSQQHWRDEREKEKRRITCFAHARAHAAAHARAMATAAVAAAERGEHWQQPWSRRHGAGSSGERGREQQRSAAESRVGTAGIAKNRRRTPRREPAGAARGPRVWWKDYVMMEQVRPVGMPLGMRDGRGMMNDLAGQARPVFMPSVTGDGRRRNDLFKDYFERSFEGEWFRGQDVGGMEEENDDGDDDDMDEDEDEEENVGGDQRTREDSVMGDD